MRFLFFLLLNLVVKIKFNEWGYFFFKNDFLILSKIFLGILIFIKLLMVKKLLFLIKLGILIVFKNFIKNFFLKNELFFKNYNIVFFKI